MSERRAGYAQLTSALTLLAPIVDLTPAHDICHLACGTYDNYPPEARDFARLKMREAIRDMRSAAKFFETRLRETEKGKRP